MLFTVFLVSVFVFFLAKIMLKKVETKRAKRSRINVLYLSRSLGIKESLDSSKCKK